MNEAKRKAALELVINQHKNIDELALPLLNSNNVNDAMLQAILFHCKSAYKVLELILEDPNG